MYEKFWGTLATPASMSDVVPSNVTERLRQNTEEWSSVSFHKFFITLTFFEALKNLRENTERLKREAEVGRFPQVLYLQSLVNSVLLEIKSLGKNTLNL